MPNDYFYKEFGLRSFMINFKTSLAYIFGLVSLIISWGIATQRSAEVELAPSPTPIATTGTIPAGARWAGCRPVSRPRSFFYSPSTSATIGING